MNSYELSRAWFDWSFEHPEKINPNHTAIYFFAIEHCNRLGWKTNFGFPTQMACEALGIKKHQTYIKYFNDLVDWGFLKLVEKSKNQYSSNIISLQSAIPKKGEALDKAFMKHGAKQTESTGQSNSPINKQENNRTNKQENKVKEVLTYFNKTTGKNFRVAKKLKARLNEGYTLDDVKKVIDIKTAEWLNTDMESYLRPDTLFSEKFDSYLNQKVIPTFKDGIKHTLRDTGVILYEWQNQLHTETGEIHKGHTLEPIKMPDGVVINVVSPCL